MLYLGIDQHKSQITVNLRSEDGNVILMRQVSTRWEKIRAFFEDLAERAAADGGFMAIVEVCGRVRLLALIDDQVLLHGAPFPAQPI